MDEQQTPDDRLAEIDLRILIALYEEGNLQFRLRYERIVERPLDDTGRNEIRSRLQHLMFEDEVHGNLTDYGLSEARLSPLMRQRLEEEASTVKGREGETWIARIRWIFDRGSDPREVRVTRRQVFDRGFGSWSAVGPR